MFEGSAANAAAADDADATFEETALALEVAAGLPATMAPEDCIMDAAEIPELVLEKSVLLLPVMVLVAGEVVLANPEAEELVPNVFLAPEAMMEELGVFGLLPLLDDTGIVCRLLGVTLEAVEFDDDMEMELLVK